jgi:ligand-binding sensor domain-containing protein
VQDAGGGLWFGLSEGIVNYNNGIITSFRDSANVQDKAFFSAFVDDINNVWFGSTTGNVLC